MLRTGARFWLAQSAADLYQDCSLSSPFSWQSRQLMTKSTGLAGRSATEEKEKKERWSWWTQCFKVASQSRERIHFWCTWSCWRLKPGEKCQRWCSMSQDGFKRCCSTRGQHLSVQVCSNRTVWTDPYTDTLKPAHIHHNHFWHRSAQTPRHHVKTISLGVFYLWCWPPACRCSCCRGWPHWWLTRAFWESWAGTGWPPLHGWLNVYHSWCPGLPGCVAHTEVQQWASGGHFLGWACGH